MLTCRAAFRAWNANTAMNLTVCEFEARNFRSIRAVNYPMSRLDVLVGANGVGKTNLYRALELMQSAARNTLARDVGREGSLASVFWAGRRRHGEEARVRLAVGFADAQARRPDKAALRYEIEIGYPPPTAGLFSQEPDIKLEALTYLGGSRPVRMIERRGPSVVVRGEDGRPVQLDMDLLASETVLARLEEPDRYPELDAVRRALFQWRFYHGLRTDAASPLRQPCPAIATPILASDGADLAAVFATLRHIRGDTADLDAAVERAFPGAHLVIPAPGRTAEFAMVFPDFPGRSFEARELSDGTLQFLALAGALLGYRLPPFMALNEPEASLHPDLMEPLAELIVASAKRTQIWLVTHSTRLADAIAASGEGKVRRILKEKGATVIEGLRAWGEFEDEDEG